MAGHMMGIPERSKAPLHPSKKKNKPVRTITQTPELTAEEEADTCYLCGNPLVLHRRWFYNHKMTEKGSARRLIPLVDSEMRFKRMHREALALGWSREREAAEWGVKGGAQTITDYLFRFRERGCWF